MRGSPVDPTPTAGTRHALWVQNLVDERDGAALYEGLAEAERDPERAKTFKKLAQSERRHGAIWERKLRNAGIEVPPERRSARVRVLLWLARRFGSSRVLPLVMQTEMDDAAKYALQGKEAADLVREEEEHERILNVMSARPAPGPGERIVRRERWHRMAQGGAIRAAVLGMNDGLISNLALVLGVAAAGTAHPTLLVTGLAGLLAGACSMAVGEYVSVASQKDLLTRQVDLERRELMEAPEEEEDELVAILQSKGLARADAVKAAHEMMKNPQTALDTLVREELGLDPSDLGSPVGAATSSFAAFAVGATVPVLPFVFLRERVVAMVVAGGSSAALLVLVGGSLGFLSGTGAVKSAARMLTLGAVAAGITIGAGHLVGVSLG